MSARRADALNDDVAAGGRASCAPHDGGDARAPVHRRLLHRRADQPAPGGRPGMGLAGVIGLYPWPVGPHRSGLPAPADEAPRFGCPVLAIYGGADAGIPPDARDGRSTAALDAAGVAHRDRRLRRRAALVLRSQGRGVRRGLRRRLAPDARIHGRRHRGVGSKTPAAAIGHGGRIASRGGSGPGGGPLRCLPARLRRANRPRVEVQHHAPRRRATRRA